MQVAEDVGDIAHLSAAWDVCTDATAGILSSGLDNCSDQYTALLNSSPKLRLCERIDEWVILGIADQFLTRARQHFAVFSEPTVSNAQLERAISNVHGDLMKTGTHLHHLEEMLHEKSNPRPSSNLRPSLYNFARKFALHIGSQLQELLPSPEQLEVALRERYLLFDVQTPRGAKSLKHTIDDVLCMQLSDLGGGRLIQQVLTQIVFGRVDELLEDDDGCLDVDASLDISISICVLPKLIRKVEHAIIPWLATVALPSGQGSKINLKSPRQHASGSNGNGNSDNNDDDKSAELARWRMQLMFHLHELVASRRTNQILDIIHDYPNSAPAVDDLKACLKATDYRPEFIKCLRNNFVNNLLNVGSTTSHIVRQYVNLIRLLHVLDPTGFILQSVSTPIRSYLRHRPDTIRCIVNGMTVDGDLYAELERAENTASGAVDDDLISIDGDYDHRGIVDTVAYENWQPEPIDAPSKESGFRAGGDAIATLVNIYGTSNLLVSEYRTLLADRLLRSANLDLDKENRVLKLLTERFGDEAMHECTIMLKDMMSSTEMLSLAPTDTIFETAIISKEFWPKLGDAEEFRVPERFAEHMKAFESTFERLKHPRKLCWQHGHGVAELNLTFEDGRSVDVTVTPLQAAILMLFGEKPKWNVEDMQKTLEVPARAIVTKAMSALAGKGVIRVTNNGNEYETVENAAAGLASVDEGDIEGVNPDEEDEGGDKNAGEMKVFESYILAMLQNLRESPLEKVHTMLKLFVKTPVYDKTQDQLAAFLRRMVKEGKIEVQAGLFKIKGK